jgi:hypothetical protein
LPQKLEQERLLAMDIEHKSRSGTTEGSCSYRELVRNRHERALLARENWSRPATRASVRHREVVRIGTSVNVSVNVEHD